MSSETCYARSEESDLHFGRTGILWGSAISRNERGLELSVLCGCGEVGGG